METKKERILTRIKEHYNYICEHYNKDQILGVFLYGSQNYNLDTEDSDVDTKAIYIPTMRELVFEAPVSKELCLPNGEHCEVKDIREMIKNFKKQNINFVEILFTEYFILNDKYAEIWKNVIKYRENIAVYKPSLTITSAAWQAINTLRQGRSILKKGETGVAPAKKLANAARLLYFLENYTICYESYLKCIQPSNEYTKDAHNIYLNLKQNKYMTEEVFDVCADILQLSLQNYLDTDFTAFDNPKHIEQTDKFFEKIVLDLIKMDENN